MLLHFFAQAVRPEVFLDTPTVDWWALVPLLVLSAPAMVLLHLSSVVRRLPVGFYAGYTILTSGIAGSIAIFLWNKIDADGPSSTLGGAFAVDKFSVFVTVVMCVSVILAALIADDYLRRERMDGAELYVLLMLSAAGGVVMAAANDLIVLFLGLEILSIAVYILSAMHLRRSTSQEAGMKYFVLGAFSSAFFLYGIALIYGATGTTSLIGIRDFLDTNVLINDQLMLGGMALLLVGFAFKIAAAPFHSWTPDVYQGSPTPTVVYMASGVKVAAFAGMLRVFVATFGGLRLDWQPIVYGLAVATLLVGTILAVVQTNVKRMMAYSSVSHAGFILLGVQAATDLGLEAALFYLAAYTFLVAGTFGIITMVAGTGDDRHELDDFRGLAKSHPMLALAFAIFLLAQTGVPLTSGFFAKFYVISAAIDARSFWLAIVAMLAAVIGAFIYLRIIVAMFMSTSDDDHEVVDLTDGASAADGDTADEASVDGAVATLTETQKQLAANADRVVVTPTAALAVGLALVATIVFGVFPGPLADWAGDALPVLVSPAVPTAG